MRFSRFHIPCAIITIALVSYQLNAQAARVSVRSSVEAALRSHATLRIASERVTAAAAGYDEAGAQLLPKLQLTGRAFALSDVEQGTITVAALPGSPSIPLFPVITHSYAARLQLTQPVFTGFRLSGAKEAAGLGVDAAKADFDYDRSRIALETERTYWIWVQAREVREVLEEMIGQMLAHERRVANMAEQGLARKLDVLTIRAKRSEVEVQAVEARTRASMALMRLNFMMGNPLDTDLLPEDLPGSVTIQETSQDLQGLESMAVQNRPDLASARLKSSVARSSVSMSHAGWYPTIALAAAFEYSNPNQRIVPPKDRFDDTWEVGVTFQWTLWDWMTTSSQAARAEAVYRQAEAGYELMKDGVRLEVAQLAQRVADSRAQLRSAEIALEAAEESFRVTEEQFSQGLATSIEVTDARIDRMRAILAHTQASTEAAVARAELRHATGAGL